jgi:hypothetical protein
MCLFLVGCATGMGMFPHSTATSVDLTKKNFRIVKANVIGEDSGFNLLGFIPLVSPKYTDAMADLYSKGNISKGKAQALVNVTQERSSIYLILFSIPKLSISADVIEFLDENGKN